MIRHTLKILQQASDKISFWNKTHDTGVLQRNDQTFIQI